MVCRIVYKQLFVINGVAQLEDAIGSANLVNNIT